MCDIKVKDRIPSKDWMTQCQYYSKTGCDGMGGMGTCCEKKTMIG